MQVNLLPTTSAFAEQLASNLKVSDQLELIASGSSDFKETILTSIASSDTSHSILVNDELICIGGIATHPDSSDTFRIGIPWLLCTTAQANYPKAFYKFSRDYLFNEEKNYDLYLNYVDVRNDISIQWLKRLGFVVAEEPTSHIDTGCLFYCFRKELSNG